MKNIVLLFSFLFFLFSGIFALLNLANTPILDAHQLLFDACKQSIMTSRPVRVVLGMPAPGVKLTAGMLTSGSFELDLTCSAPHEDGRERPGSAIGRK